jgi:hypothetical protein
LELALSSDYAVTQFAPTFALFVVAAFAEIGGGYLAWLWVKGRRKQPIIGVVGGIVLLFLWSNSHIPAIQFRQGVCDLWRNILTIKQNFVI